VSSVDSTAAGSQTTGRFLRPEVIARISGLELRARLAVEGFVSGMHQSPYRGYSVEFAEHREYVPGDDIRHIDWRVWGRGDRFYIKQYEEETNLRTHVLLDVSSSMRYPDHPTGTRLNKFEYAATLAASLAFLLVNQQDAVGLLLFDEAVQAELPPLSSQAHLRALIAQMERARLERPSRSETLQRDLAGQMRRRGLVVLISDLLWDPEALIRAFDRLCYDRHEVIVMHVLDEDERTFPFRDNTRFEGLEAPELQLPVDPQSLRKSYLEALGRFISRVRAACVDRRIDYVGLSTADPLDVGLRRYLAAREHALKR
jgi:uncharacterized protein (DUF58 family)